MLAVPLLTMRLVRHRATDLTRLVAVGRIVTQVEHAKLEVHWAAAALAEAVTARHPYPRWAATLGWASQAAAVALLFGGSAAIASAAFAVTALIDRLGRLLSRWGVAPFFLQLVGALVASLSTIGLLAFGVLPPRHRIVVDDRGRHRRSVRSTLVTATTSFVGLIAAGGLLVLLGADAGLYLYAAGAVLALVWGVVGTWLFLVRAGRDPAKGQEPAGGTPTP